MSVFERLVDNFIAADAEKIDTYVSRMRQRHPELSDDDLAKKIVKDKAWRNGLSGAVTGIGGIVALPLMVSADLVISWRIQVAMTFAIARVYGRKLDDPELKEDIYLIMAGDSAKESVKRVGIAAAQKAALRSLRKDLTRNVRKRVTKRIRRKILGKSVGRLGKVVPLVGIPFGFAFDYFAARAAGRAAIRYYQRAEV